VLIERVAEKCKELIEKVAKKNDIEIISLSVQLNHIHLFVSTPSRFFSPSVLVNLFKGYTSRYLLQEFQSLESRIDFGQELTMLEMLELYLKK